MEDRQELLDALIEARDYADDLIALIEAGTSSMDDPVLVELYECFRLEVDIVDARIHPPE